MAGMEDEMSEMMLLEPDDGRVRTDEECGVLERIVIRLTNNSVSSVRCANTVDWRITVPQGGARVPAVDNAS